MTPQNSNISTINELNSESISIQNMIDAIIDLDKKLKEILDGIKELELNKLKDSRMLFFRYISELNSITIFQLSFQAESYIKLRDKNWIKQRLPHLTELIDKISNIQDYSNNRNKNISKHIWDCFILGYFYEFETRLRSIVRNIGTIENLNSTKKYKKLNGNESFYLIYRGLYESYLRLDKAKYEVLKFFSEIRNTIHNSGIYFPKKKNDRTFRYKNKSYHFRYGNPVSFLDFDLKKNILKDLLILFSRTINHRKIKDIELIIDPISNVKFIGLE